MDLSEASSPALPPGLAVTPAADDIHRHAHNGRIDDEEPAEQAPRRTRRARNAFEGNIPVVTDPTADRLRERFYQFLTERGRGAPRPPLCRSGPSYGRK
ncbi:hypothetical protein BDV93DRAFT_562428 [Ceratobasidium sp. AG-I]|nr:hypothetical protein BDV93DRAFT_562428 [Ceratobasidium sp. AG-I]